ncbi:MAG: polysaccharide deacetylase family protein [Christensenellaceae bacterium]|jgi:polysaccharide deacetylase family sporulation protein PdaB|nr:polysaccharide deacetylase family protein [Christensenellaceae bacterium]
MKLKAFGCVALILGLCCVISSANLAASYVAAKNRLLPIYCVENEANEVAISFDAAWGADKTLNILDLLDKFEIKATFFLVGFWVDKYPDMVREIFKRGHEIGTHTNTHPNLTSLSRDGIKKELEISANKITAITGEPVSVFRPPFGAYNNAVIEVASSLGLATIQWDVDTLDWKGLSGGEIAARVIKKTTSGSIILAHNNSDHIVEALPTIFSKLKPKFTFKKMSELILKGDFYIDNNGKQCKNS